MTPEQQAACQADVDAEIVRSRAPAVGKVYEQSAWSDPETGECFGPSWVAEVRIRRPEGMRVVFVDADVHPANRAAFCQVLSFEILTAMGRRR